MHLSRKRFALRWFVVSACTTAMLAVLPAVPAQADAGNPILGTIRATVVPDASGPGVTVFVRGEWNWLSHNSDCNFDRAATGVAIIWNDPNSPGYTISGHGITASVGIVSSTDGNAPDPMVHPVDRGNLAEGYSAGTWQSTAVGYPTTAAGDYPSGQVFADPSSNNPNDYAKWKGGCGREPITATASKAANGSEGTGVTCADGTTTCASHPWGSWGYEKVDGQGHVGYSHHYARISDLTSVCANFYDVHGGGKYNSGKMQLVQGASQITVTGNSDNSIQSNSFNPAQGGNCTGLNSLISGVGSGPVTIGQSITDTATLRNLLPPANNTYGSITFTACAPKPDGTADTTCANPVFTFVTPPGTVTGNDTYTSPPFTPSGTGVQIAGVYVWTAVYSGDGLNAPAATALGDAAQRSVVNRFPTSIPAAEKLVLVDFAKVAPVSGKAIPTGTVDFQLFSNNACTGTPLYDSGPVTLVNGAISTAAAATQPPALKVNGTYYWREFYSGDANYTPSTHACGRETVSITGNSPGIDP